MKHIHHIIPRHMGGTDDPSNLIELTVEEHAEAHRLLWEEHRNDYDRIAWQCLSGQIDNMEANIQATKAANTGKDPWNKGLKGTPGRPAGLTHDEEIRKKISENTKQGMLKTGKKLGAPKGNVPWNKGKKTGPHSPEQNKKISESLKKTKRSKKEGPEAL